MLSSSAIGPLLQMWPKSVTEVSTEFLSSIIGRPIQSFCCEKTDIQGGCSFVYRFAVTFEAFPPLRVYFKFPLVQGDPDRNVGINRAELVRVAAYRKEVAFYRFLKETKSGISSIAPPVYFAEIDLTAEDEFLLVLGEAGRALDQLHNCPRDISRQVVGQLARMHSLFVNATPEQFVAAGLGDCLTSSHTLICRISGLPDSTTVEKLLQFCKTNFESKFHDFSAVMYAIGDAQIVAILPEALKLVENGEAAKRIEAAFDSSFLKPTFKVLLHGDFRPDNLLFDEDEQSIKIIDFQALAYGHPSYDLAQFLSQSHDELTAELFDELVTIYYNTLCENFPSVGAVSSLPELKAAVQSATIFQLLMLSLHCAPLRAAIEAETGKLPDSFGRFLPLLVAITRRGLHAFLSEPRKFY